MKNISVQSRKYSRGFRHEVQASCRHQAHCLRRSRVCATDGKKAHALNRKRSGIFEPHGETFIVKHHKS